MRGGLSKIQQFLADNVVEGCLEPEAGLNALYRLALLDPDWYVENLCSLPHIQGYRIF